MTLTRAGDNLLISLNGSVLTGNGAANTLTGAEGNDTYVGGAGNDALNDTSTSSNVIYRWGVGQDNDSQSSRNDCTGGWDGDQRRNVGTAFRRGDAQLEGGPANAARAWPT